MTALSAQLLAAVEAAELSLRTIPQEATGTPLLAGGWSRKEVLGHLIDSASNNHQRWVRAALAESLTFPSYEQAAWSRVQSVRDAPWGTLLMLWAAYNRYLGHILAHLPAEKLDVPCSIGGADPIPLRLVAEGYLVHLKHHLAQIGAEIG